MKNWNKGQQEVIKHGKGAAMVVAGAGSGKTAVTIERIKRLLESGARNIVAITFTKNSANDLKKKLNALGIEGKVLVGTFHAVMGRILSMEGIYQSDKIKAYEIENIFNKIYKEDKVDMNDVLGFISYQKAYMRSYKDDFIYKESQYTDEELRRFYKAYEDYKNSKRLMDFDDVLLKGYEILMEQPGVYTCDYLLVDEAQDCNLIQNAIADALCPSGNIMYVGDYRQSIYSFNGSVPKMFMTFDKRYPDAKIINLDYNYRSNKEIVLNANSFIAQYYGDYEHYSDSIPNSTEAAIIDWEVSITQENEAVVVVNKVKEYLQQGIEPNEIAILYRNNIQCQHVENELVVNDIDYFIEKNGGFFNRKEIDIILCMLRLISNNEDDAAYENIIKARIPYFKFFKAHFINDVRTMAGKMNTSYLLASEVIPGLQRWQLINIQQFNDAVRRLSYQYQEDVSLDRIIQNIINVLSLDAYLEDKYAGEELDERRESVENLKKFIRNNTVDSFLKFVYEVDHNNKKNDENKIQLMTIHKSKGLEFKKVIVIGLQEGKFPSSKVEDITEEARLFYVACTRPKEELLLSQVGLNNIFCEQYNGI